MQQPIKQTPALPALVAANGAVAFVLEVAMLVAAFFWGFRSFPAPWGIIIGIVLALVLVVFWAYFMAPKAKRRLGWPVQPLLALLLFVVAAVALIVVGWTILGVIMMVIAVLNTALTIYLGRQGRGQESTGQQEPQPGETEPEK
ncbi:amino acid transporter [Psychromicrobium silvestre]|uniref:Amino acid transporter n=1 Tax=Psychromicrobium silvestre TaxID=1645614 RepID=A0A7Y9LSN3_9MICC|nr:YrdB family protein [Psychromicrobium silvestre]NYE94861.1 amino acid transporter [Psychromicrobium silvestre]